METKCATCNQTIVTHSNHTMNGGLPCAPCTLKTCHSKMCVTPQLIKHVQLWTFQLDMWRPIDVPKPEVESKKEDVEVQAVQALRNIGRQATRPIGRQYDQSVFCEDLWREDDEGLPTDDEDYAFTLDGFQRDFEEIVDRFNWKR